ncbi:hypothetical protein [Moraxella lacunata]|uniref:hypothetical protein n=1 Tax=Moraxella lacunata TaxID=477 RepID=UPI003EE0787F
MILWMNYLLIIHFLLSVFSKSIPSSKNKISLTSCPFHDKIRAFMTLRICHDRTNHARPIPRIPHHATACQHHDHACHRQRGD